MAFVRHWKSAIGRIGASGDNCMAGEAKDTHHLFLHTAGIFIGDERLGAGGKPDNIPAGRRLSLDANRNYSFRFGSSDDILCGEGVDRVEGEGKGSMMGVEGNRFASFQLEISGIFTNI